MNLDQFVHISDELAEFDFAQAEMGKVLHLKTYLRYINDTNASVDGLA